MHEDESLSSQLGYPSPPWPNPPTSEPKAAELYCAPDIGPPAWSMNYIIGTGAYGTVFLENVHLHGMESPELWAVKRIPRAVPNFTPKRYQAEINNLQALARESFSRTFILS